MIGRSVAATLLAGALLAPPSGCAFAVDHPAVTAGIVGGTLGLGTCKLASDDIGACLAVAGAAGAFLAVVTATALWLGGDGHSVMIEEQARPLPDDGRPIRRHQPAVDPDAAPVTSPVPLGPAPASPAPTSPAPTSPAPSSAAPVSPAPTSPTSSSPAP